MRVEEAVKASSVVREEHKASLIECLRRIPDFSWLLGRPHGEIDRLQGDFFHSFPVAFMKPDCSIAEAKAVVMIVNNTCDLHNQPKHVTVAPTFDLEKYLQHQAGRRSTSALADHERDIRRNQISELLYVPDLPHYPGGAIVRLDMLCTVPADFLSHAVSASSRLASFTQKGAYVLLLKLVHHFARLESHEVNRN